MIIKRSFCAGISGAPRAGRQRPPEHTEPRAGAAPQEGGGAYGGRFFCKYQFFNEICFHRHVTTYKRPSQ